MTGLATRGMTMWLEDLYASPPLTYWGEGEAISRRGQDAITRLEQLMATGAIPRLSAEARVFESGCNQGQVLWAIYKTYGSRVTGMDGSPRAILFTQQAPWRDVPAARFYLGNVLVSPWFRLQDDRAFDLVLTRWHLVHIPPSPLKRAYVEQLKRIGKATVLLEPYGLPSHPTGELILNETDALSFEDWGTYGFQHVPTTGPVAGTECFVHA